MNEHEQTADVLDGAADSVERDGWARFAFGSREGGDAACANGHIGRASRANGYPNRLPFSGAFGQYLINTGQITGPASQGSPSAAVLGWNDAPERTKQEVLDALRLAAKDQRRLADGIES